ncbi:class F sortase [Streptomyces sp. NBC_01260]|uniref:class F sortase n=2 Tax=Streptomyces TaxID=1883 RepID=UPI000FB3FE97|nr:MULTISPECIES: class F sortase [unclassified Streptomyces]MCX4770574.1 class F sortase [Streptomyces sp. NBC_01285]ROQ82039.1 sortase family protein [Streptomyces sp. CEV 2-1]
MSARVPRERPPRRPFPRLTGAAGLIPAAAAALVLLLGSPLAESGTGTVARSGPAPTAAAPLPAARPAALPAARPVRIDIPGLGVSAPLVDLTLDSRDKLGVPDPADRNLAGWYRDGVTPGSPGNAIVVAHVDTPTGPAAFAGLDALPPGATVDVRRADRKIATFRVYAIEEYEKNDFPSTHVYGPTKDAQLRLLTCGGAYDRSAGGYQSNVVAFARLASVRAG